MAAIFIFAPLILYTVQQPEAQFT